MALNLQVYSARGRKEIFVYVVTLYYYTVYITVLRFLVKYTLY